MNEIVCNYDGSVLVTEFDIDDDAIITFHCVKTADPNILHLIKDEVIEYIEDEIYKAISQDV